MDPGVIAVFIPIVAVGGFFAWMISLSPAGRAYAERLRAQTKRDGETGDSEEIALHRRGVAAGGGGTGGAGRFYRTAAGAEAGCREVAAGMSGCRMKHWYRGRRR